MYTRYSGIYLYMMLQYIKNGFKLVVGDEELDKKV